MRLTALSAAILLWAGPALAADAIGTASLVQGAATVRRGPATAAWAPLKPGAPVYQGDRVKTAAGAVKLTFNDESSITLAPRSEVELNEFVYKPQSSRRSFFSLWGGKLKASVSKFLQKDNDVRIATPTAVAGVRGTEFLVELEGEEGKPEDAKTNVVVFEGKVAVKSALKEIADEIALEAGQQSTIGFKKAPGAMVALTPQALRAAQRSASAKSSGSLRGAVGGSQLRAAAADIGGGTQLGGSGGPALGAPPIQQQPTDGQKDTTLTIKVRIPEQQ